MNSIAVLLLTLECAFIHREIEYVPVLLKPSCMIPAVHTRDALKQWGFFYYLKLIFVTGLRIYHPVPNENKCAIYFCEEYSKFDFEYSFYISKTGIQFFMIKLTILRGN